MDLEAEMFNSAHTTCYIRIPFSTTSLDIMALTLDIRYDDGFVAYINGTEVARENVQDPISWNMELNDYYEAIMYTGVNPYRYKLKEFVSSVLVSGKNVLAVEVHSWRAGANDFSANVFLHAKISTPDTIYGPVPEWFGEMEVIQVRDVRGDDDFFLPDIERKMKTMSPGQGIEIINDCKSCDLYGLNHNKNYCCNNTFFP